MMLLCLWISPLCRNVLKQLAAQSYRCTGCGMKQEPSQARHFRFCNYTGKYFCQKCHTNATSVIPAYIMDRWSFRKWACMHGCGHDQMNAFQVAQSAMVFHYVVHIDMANGADQYLVSCVAMDPLYTQIHCTCTYTCICVWYRYYISNFARDLLARIHYDPVFVVQDVNPQIYSRVPVLAQARVSPVPYFLCYFKNPLLYKISNWL